MNALISPDIAATIQQAAQRMNKWLQGASREQVMTSADQWLCSVWNGTADWLLLERILANDEPAAVSIPVLMGCLQVYRHHQPDTRQATLLERINTVAYEWATSRLSEGQVGMLTGGAAALHYLLRAGAYTDKTHPYARQLTRQALDRLANPADSGTDLSVGNGQTGLLLTLVDAARQADSQWRIGVNVTDVKAAVSHYVRYLSEYQIPIDSQTGNWSVFPNSVAGSEWNVTNRLSWEAGDLGQLLLLYQAHQLLDQPDIARWADRLSGYILQRRAMDRVGMDSIGLIDGMAGLSLLYRRLYLLTGHPGFWHEGEHWLRQLVTDTRLGTPPTNGSLLTGMLGIIATLRRWLGSESGVDLLFL